MTPSRRPAGMVGFTVVTIGQVVSLLGTGMTGFGLTIWAFGETGRATDLALIGFFFITPLLVVSPFAGVLVDRYNRRLMMMISDLGAGVATIIVLILFATGHLQIWHLYISNLIAGMFQAFQFPAYSAAITLMLPKEQYTRANSLLELANAASNVFAPLAAGALLGLIGLRGILIIDIVTFCFAIATLLIVDIPEPERTAEHGAGQGNVFKEAGFGIRYVLQRPSLLMLQTVFLVGNFFAGLAITLLAPMILARTGNDELLFASVQSVGAVGGVVGSLVISAWGGFKRRIHGVLLGWMITGWMGFVVAAGRPEPVWAGAALWSAGIFVFSFIGPLINASNSAIWQSKVAPDIQGRVFSIRALIAWIVIPLSRLVAGPLADQVMEPAMQEGGRLVGTFGWLVGSGPGAGMALIFAFCGLGIVAATLAGYLVPHVRNVEDILPDHDAAPAQAQAEAQP